MKIQVLFSKDFKKKMKKLDRKISSLFDRKLELFMNDPTVKILNTHNLKGKYIGHKSFNVTGDFRVVYQMLDDATAYFVDIDSHSNLYE